MTGGRESLGRLGLLHRQRDRAVADVLAAADDRGDVADEISRSRRVSLSVSASLSMRRLGAWVSAAWTASSAMSAARGSSPAGVRARGLEAVA
jgi:hypothetical protein